MQAPGPRFRALSPASRGVRCYLSAHLRRSCALLTVLEAACAVVLLEQLGHAPLDSCVWSCTGKTPHMFSPQSLMHACDANMMHAYVAGYGV
jgi:hypothetical protein